VRSPRCWGCRLTWSAILQVSLIFGNQTEDDIILKPELDNMARKHKNFKVPLDTCPPLVWAP